MNRSLAVFAANCLLRTKTGSLFIANNIKAPKLMKKVVAESLNAGQMTGEQHRLAWKEKGNGFEKEWLWGTLFDIWFEREKQRQMPRRRKRAEARK
jgi:hypothetical protein